MSLPTSVLHVLAADSLGGCESLSLALARDFARAGGWTQDVLFLGPLTGLISGEFQRAGVMVHSRPFRGKLQLFRDVFELCRTRKYRYVLTHGFGTHLWIACAAFASMHCKTLAFVGNPAPRSLIQRLATALYSWLAFPFVHRHVACSQYVAESMVRGYGLPRGSIEVVPNWCDVDSIREAAERSRQRRLLVGSPVIGMVARLDPIKDFATAIESFAILRQRLPDATFRVIGDGPLRADLERLAAELCVADCVSFLGRRSDVPAELGQFDLFAYATTVDEGFGIVLIEAMAADVPIVCTDIGPSSEVLDGGRVGVLVSARDPQAMAQALYQLWMDAGRRAALVEAGARLVRERYATPVAAVRICEMLRA